MSCTPQSNDFIYRAWEMPPLFLILNEGAKTVLNPPIQVEKLVTSRQSLLISLFPDTSPWDRWGWDTGCDNTFSLELLRHHFVPRHSNLLYRRTGKKGWKGEGKEFHQGLFHLWKYKLFFLLLALKFYP